MNLNHRPDSYLDFGHSKRDSLSDMERSKDRTGSSEQGMK